MSNFYKDKVCLNVLAGSLNNATEIYKVCKYVLVGVLSANYPSVNAAVDDMSKYMDVLEDNLSVGLGAGNPNQWKDVAEISEKLRARHFNQVFSAVGYTRASTLDKTSMINALVSPTGKVGYVKISTGPLSKDSKEAAIVPIETAILMIKEMGGNSLKFFPMKGLDHLEEYKAVAESCAKNNFILEPTGGIDLENFETILKVALDANVPKVIPHVYSSIIDKDSGNTKVDDVKTLMSIVEKLV